MNIEEIIGNSITTMRFCSLYPGEKNRTLTWKTNYSFTLGLKDTASKSKDSFLISLICPK